MTHPEPSPGSGWPGQRVLVGDKVNLDIDVSAVKRFG
jgi:hypothetical protein